MGSGGIKKAMRIVAVPIKCAVFVSWCFMFSIEGKALDQLDHATAQYSRPMHLKGVVRYVTPDQEQEDALAHWGFLGGVLLILGLAQTDKWLEKRGTPRAGSN
jgi:hypothetical protein